MNAIARLRIYKGMVQKELAEELNISVSSLRAYENMEIGKVPYPKRMTIANYFGVKTQDLSNGRY